MTMAICDVLFPKYPVDFIVSSNFTFFPSNCLFIRKKYVPDEIMGAAVRKFESVTEDSSSIQTDGIVDSLKLFIEVYKQLLNESHYEGKTSMLLPKVYFFISLCNLKLCNIKQAYVLP